MSIHEILKRLFVQIYIYYSWARYRNPANCKYISFFKKNITLKYYPLPGTDVNFDKRKYGIFKYRFDLINPIKWNFSGNNRGRLWPIKHFIAIDYRHGNPYGDVRINWELNRLQFLPAMAMSDENSAKRILLDWIKKNPYLHGPAYISSMEVALRWISIYRTVCLFKQPLDSHLQQTIAGFAIASGKFIEKRLSTHSSAGNHLIVEAVGLFWLGKALGNHRVGIRWISKARKILWFQIQRQINPDGTNQEQSFWYLGFVVDALLHYLQLEDSNIIPDDVCLRINKALQFIHELTLPDGSFPDYGDRDDGYVLRISNDYTESPFPGLLNTGAYLFKRPEWLRSSESAKERFLFWQNDRSDDQTVISQIQSQKVSSAPRIKIYPDGGMTLMQWGRGRLLFRHAPLGMENTYGHGHADALSVTFCWDLIQVLIDLGSGQYNGDQNIRNYFRSTIAHNTVEIGGQNQAKIMGPFMWDKSYNTRLKNYSESPTLMVEAAHDGYMRNFGRLHTRKIKWLEPDHFNICDSFSNGSEVPIRGAFHLGSCRTVCLGDSSVEADFNKFKFIIQFSTDFSVEVYYGSNNPFAGWRSKVYGKWEPVHSVIFSGTLQSELEYQISLKILEK